MGDLIVSLFDGLGSGAVYGALALALVVTYRSSGVVNFATGAMALYIAYTYAFLRRGELLIPFPGFKTTAHLGSSLGFWPAFAISMAIAALLGIVLYLLVFRLLQNAPAVAKAVASIGVMLVLQAMLAVRVGTSPVSTKPILPHDTFNIFGERIRGDRVWFAAIIVVIALVLAATFRYTRFGLATRAVAETETGAYVSGLSPQRIALTNWAISTAVAGISGILIAPLVPVIPISYTLFIVPALAAALAGSFSSVVVAVGAGLAIGMLQSVLVSWQVHHTWLPTTGLPEMVPLVLILVVLVARGKPLPSRGTLLLQTLGDAPRPRSIVVPAIVGTGIGVVALFACTGAYRLAVISTLLFAIVALSLVVVTGYAGQLSLAQLTLAGVGAFMVTRFADQWGIPFPFAPLLAAVVAGVVGTLFGLPALRIRGLPVAVVTLSLAVALEAVWFRNSDYNGGIKGAKVKAPSLFGFTFRTDALSSRIPFGLLVLGVLVAVATSVALLRRHRLGAAMLAVRANERSAAAAGINVSRIKLTAFAIGSFIAGLGGAFSAYFQGAAVATSYSAVVGLGLFATAYLAGITSIAGGLLAGVLAVGGIFFTLIDKHFDFGRWYVTVSGLVLILTVIRNPEGAIKPAHALARRWRNRGSRREPVTTPQLLPDAGLAPFVANALSDVSELEVRDIFVRFGGVVAVNGVSLKLPRGAIVGLIGPNGAGKTTFVDAISGFASSTGSVTLGGVSLDGLAPHQRTRSGLGRTFQGIELYEDLSVAENIEVGQEAARHGGQRGGSSGDVDDVLDLLRLRDVRNRAVRELSAGHRQLVSVGRALAGRPSVLLLDEPAGGLDSNESLWLGERLRDICASGVTVLMIDHDMQLVLRVCDLIYVLDFGAVIASGSAAEVQADPRVGQAYLGALHAVI